MTQITKHTDDSILWDSFRDGNEAAYTELAKRYYRTLLHYGLRFTPNVQIAEDTLQDLLIHLWLHRENLNDTPSVKFYLLKSFRHRIIKTLKPFSEELELTDHFEDHLQEFSSEEVIIQNENEAGLKNQVQELMTQLPARQREVVYLRFFQGLKSEEIGNLLAIKPQSVSNILQRALSNLRNLWPVTPSFSFIFYSFFEILL
ncbi:sigma-70 family RNA polymerase sigma factor [Dyadobacter sp. LHD-138]|uniref:RNA polymerase sigma factor n=1 Tax=Dyadobacter sp. LHD-138 TaxID=3071413 RepID=UPI0027DFEF41|nr:sigma-70 family RNA polymerase sigma factor [Dyadobacter sp. LHD-138]MDQ6477461.1 sigma-70 family RNA polymerase sigma factor [Dyadobacter sp. LHD-138]